MICAFKFGEEISSIESIAKGIDTFKVSELYLDLVGRFGKVMYPPPFSFLLFYHDSTYEYHNSESISPPHTRRGGGQTNDGLYYSIDRTTILNMVI